MRRMGTLRGYVIAALAVVLWWSCLPDPLEVRNIPALKPEIVVNTQIIPDESLVVFLTKTFGALEASDDSDPFELVDAIAVNDATVILDGPTSSDTLLFLGAGIYGGLTLSLNAGETYTLRVISPSMGTVRATTTVTPRVEFESLSLKRYFNGYDDTLMQVSYSINDPEDRNFYMINVQRLTLRDDLAERLLNPYVYTRVIDDAEYNGMVITDTLHATPRDYAPGDTVAVFLSNIQESYYNFIKLRLDNRVGFVEFVSEPVNYPTNVEGGRGFFNLHLPDVRVFVVE
ncbi:MAG: DUF4249 domain-containing protein [Bacteroidota bacterium]|jgi:hypothetical protein|nr:MAG: hypothetical protein DIU61_02510 [Bacteroidota bacterium]